jgi:enoyl-[acyl-carrier protein] reductase I
MGFLTNKKLLITGLLSNRSIAYGIAKAALREGASLAFSYAGGEKIEKRVKDLARDFDTDLVFPLRCR